MLPGCWRQDQSKNCHHIHPENWIGYLCLVDTCSGLERKNGLQRQRHRQPAAAQKPDTGDKGSLLWMVPI